MPTAKQREQSSEQNPAETAQQHTDRDASRRIETVVVSSTVRPGRERGAEAALSMVFLAGLWKTWTYAAGLALHTISTLSTWKQLLAPLGEHYLFISSPPFPCSPASWRSSCCGMRTRSSPPTEIAVRRRFRTANVSPSPSRRRLLGERDAGGAAAQQQRTAQPALAQRGDRLVAGIRRDHLEGLPVRPLDDEEEVRIPVADQGQVRRVASDEPNTPGITITGVRTPPAWAA
jgi:hypothetical protein